MAAICQRCGGTRSSYDQICPACGHRPRGDGLLVAWLLSSRHLDPESLEQVAARIGAGESIRPSARQLDRARRALGQDLSTDPGLTVGQRLGVLLTSLVLTPLVGWTGWLWWRESRPRAAKQALALSLPATVVLTVLLPAIWWVRAVSLVVP